MSTNDQDEKASNAAAAAWQFSWQRPRWNVVQDAVSEGTGSNEETQKSKKNNPLRSHPSSVDVEGTCLCVASAHVSHDEVPDFDETDSAPTTTSSSSQQQQQQQQQQPLSSSLVLTVSVVSSPFCTAVSSEIPASGDETTQAASSSKASSNSTNSTSTASSKNGDLLVLEILRQPGPLGKDEIDDNDDEPSSEKKAMDNQTETEVPQRLFVKVLRWPGVALQKSVEAEPESWRHHLPTWLGGIEKGSGKQFLSLPQEQSIGVVAACLCRRLVEGENNNQERAAAALDALDTMTLLSLGMDPEIGKEAPPSSSVEQSIDDPSTIRDNEDEKTAPATSVPPELVLACLTSDGQVHVYSPWKLLQLPSSKTNEEKGEEDVFANSMSSFLLGDFLLEQLQSNIWPLSQPEATVKLTVPMRKLNGRTDITMTADTITNNYGSDEEDHPNGNSKSQGVSFWDRSVWDPTVDPFTTIYRTEHNIPTHCISAFEYIVIAGRGKRMKSGKQKRAGKKATKEGGFMTLLSLRHYSEVRTLFLPFVPTNLSPFAWGGMQFLFVFGTKGVAIAVRVDISINNSVICGEAPNLVPQNDPNESLISTVNSEQSLHSARGSKTPELEKQKKPRCTLHRFQILPIVLPDTITEDADALSVAMSNLFGSSPFTSPPRLAIVCQTQTQNTIVMQRALESIDYHRYNSSSPSFQLFRSYRRSRDRRILAIGTSHESRHTALITPPSAAKERKEGCLAPAPERQWCHLGQGWCLIGIFSRVYFICWDGATSSRGAFVQELLISRVVHQQSRGCTCDILPLDPYAIEANTMGFFQGRKEPENLALPFTQGVATRNSKLRRLVNDKGNSVLGKTDISGLPEEYQDDADSLVNDAIRSISNAGPTSRYSHREKSVRLLKQVPVWSQLDNTAQNRIRLEGQVPSIYVRLPDDVGPPCLLTVRRIYSENGVATPFHQILSWLSNNKDYFTAASVALDLLRDAGTLLHLWRSFERIDEDGSRTKLEGLLDGIVPMITNRLSTETNDPLAQATVTQLADMTVGCLTRGGFSMSSTLEYFLQHDQHYDSSRTCLILAAIAAQAVSDDEATMVSLMGQNYETPEDQDRLLHDILWPLRCLLQVGSSRNYLASTLALLNAVVPDELRRKKDHKEVDAMALCHALVKLIVGASSEATGMLLDLEDEQQKRFWYSLDHETQMELALILIDEKQPLLRQPEIRTWAVEYLGRYLHNTGARDINDVPTDWLRRLCAACLSNAQCDVGALLSWPDRIADKDYSDDGVKEHVRELTLARDALVAGRNSGGVDFNLLIPALLILQIRKMPWDSNSWVPTQSILNAACDMAGRKTAVEPMFSFDGNTLMKQCFLAENICAGANLIGGKNGLVVECCSILIECCGMTMEAAEFFLLSDSMNLEAAILKSPESEKVADDFELSYGHRHVLWLLEEHVLNVRTYGEFDASRGKVDPVFAARVCLRTWFSLTKLQLPSASAWLAAWLRRQLEIGDTVASTKRLACATLARVLLWSAGLDEGNVLAEQMHFESRFLVQLSQGCWSLTESVPPSIADELLALDAVDGSRG